ncbi:PREDICTED: regulator of G-protein signaling 10 isoform X1 [Corvus brachyrhynchos]|uniref:regulator of G-protein signaling 10 isoform X1 n=1 Tax=Corvus brachyrhynchos TaxID=85066 RepID=UPI0008167DE5|nr:PREDICTED: regulator of G-protein signaling 10 isoform X1 [Corvus brachyrhynchos]XP_017602349.1 PREDICTED: regulator of G-protein signaling 10 isoform X1 [Corvus brachyrhynchos]
MLVFSTFFFPPEINDIEGHPSSSHQTLKGTSKWATSLESLLEDPEGVKRFREFLKKEFSEENVLFWLACEEFKKTQGKKQMQEKAKEIYMTFLSSKASSQVNVEGQSRLSETILETPHPLMFQKLQDQCHRDGSDSREHRGEAHAPLSLQRDTKQYETPKHEGQKATLLQISLRLRTLVHVFNQPLLKAVLNILTRLLRKSPGLGKTGGIKITIYHIMKMIWLIELCL